jgi:hypothetical protein
VGEEEPTPEIALWLQPEPLNYARLIFQSMSDTNSLVSSHLNVIMKREGGELL